MNKKQGRKALGRGLANLIPVHDEEEKGIENEIVEVSIDAIKPNPFQPRHVFNQEEIKGLAESISQQGLLQPIVLRKKLDGYEIISGERRFRAFQFLNRDKVPCVIKGKVSDRQMLELALVENIQRENLNDIETALSFQRLLVECNLSHEELSERVGKSRSAITNFLRLLKLPQKVQDLLSDKKITMGHARALLSLKDESAMIESAQHIVEFGLSVRDVEKGVHPEKKAPGKKSETQPVSPEPIDPDVQDLVEKLEYRFGTSVRIHRNKGGKGKMEIHFVSDQDLNRILDTFFAQSV